MPDAAAFAARRAFNVLGLVTLVLLGGGSLPAAAGPAAAALPPPMLTGALVSAIEHPGEPIAGNLYAVARAGNSWWYGTPNGVYVRPDSGPGGTLGGISGAVLAIAPAGSAWIVAGTEGAWRAGAAVEKITLPADWTGLPVTSVAVTGATGWLGGPAGLVRLDGTAARIENVPTSSREILALAANGEDLLAAFPDGVRSRNGASGAWRDVLPGVRCERLLAGPGGAWMALTAGGDLLRGSARPANTSSTDVLAGVEPVVLDGPRDAITSLAPGNRPDREALAGTYRGRVLALEWSGGPVTTVFAGMASGVSATAPVTALAADGVDRIRLATGGTGPWDLYRTGDGARIDPHALAVAHVTMPDLDAGPGSDAPGGAWRERALGFIRNPQKLWVPVGSFLESYGLWFVALLVGAVLMLMGFARLFLGSGRRDSRQSRQRRKREEAAVSSGPPLIIELSPEVAVQAERFRILTLRIDDLSREAARGLVDAAKIEARKSTVELIEVEGWMREKLSSLQPALLADRERLAAMSAESGSDAAERERLEERIEQEEKDCAYLRYVLED